jgi:hypothetical protein
VISVKNRGRKCEWSNESPSENSFELSRILDVAANKSNKKIDSTMNDLEPSFATAQRPSEEPTAKLRALGQSPSALVGPTWASWSFAACSKGLNPEFDASGG